MKREIGDMVKVGDKWLFAWLPQLGPVLGWTRRVDDEQRGDDQRCPTGRVWAKADDVYTSAAPVAAVTAVWDKRKNDFDAHSIQFWPIHTATLPDTRPGVAQHFARADVRLQKLPQEHVVRMAFIHGIPTTSPEEGDCVVQPPMDFLRQTRDTISGVAEIPASNPVAYESLFKCGYSADELVTKLFANLENALKKRAELALKPIPDTLSRERRRKASIEDCEIAWSEPPHEADTVLRFTAGCCRYPGTGFDRELADRALGAVADLVDTPAAPDFVVMLGDQIYADATAGVFDVDARAEKYTTRYDAAFGSEHFRRLTSRVPTYMLADDHEVRDGWPNDTAPGPAPRPDHWDRSAWWAWSLFLTHQRWHGPDKPDGLMSPKERAGLCFNFDARHVPFFAFDARFEREPNGAQIVRVEQIEAFGRWLEKVVKWEHTNKQWRHIPKFVLSGSVIAPGLRRFENDDQCARRSDNWQAYARERAAIAQLIAESRTENIVFLSGDYHCSAVGKLRFYRRDGGVSRGYAIIAPPLYAPFPFANANPDDVSDAGKICSPYEPERALADYEARAVPGQGFALISVHRERTDGTPDDWSIRVEFHRDCWVNGGDVAPKPHAESTLAGGGFT